MIPLIVTAVCAIICALLAEYEHRRADRYERLARDLGLELAKTDARFFRMQGRAVRWDFPKPPACSYPQVRLRFTIVGKDSH